MAVWRVELIVYGPISVKERIRLIVPKGVRPPQEQFYSEIDLRNGSLGVAANLTARADTDKLARKAALFFFGQMLDMLALQIDLPMYIRLLDGQQNRAENHDVKRIIEPDEWRIAFSDARILNKKATAFLRAVGWYRKGLYTEDPFDKFLAFWNSIEIAANKYSPDLPPKPDGTPAGTKDKVKACFRDLWGNQNQWPIIGEDTNWVRDNYKLRVDIAHGLISVDVKQVEAILGKIITIQRVAHIFLSTFKEVNITPEIPTWIQEQPQGSTLVIQ